VFSTAPRMASATAVYACAIQDGLVLVARSDSASMIAPITVFVAMEPVLVHLAGRVMIAAS
jgi:hypothetical protein